MSIRLVEFGTQPRSGEGTTIPNGRDRRRATRFEAVEDRVWLGWWDGETFQTLGALLLDISRTGVAIACHDGPAVDQDGWFCIIGPSLSGGARARVVGRDPIPGHADRIRLRMQFQTTCPEDVYLVALGMLSSNPGQIPRQDAVVQSGSM